MIEINPDTLRERIRERLEESDGTTVRGYCWVCQAALTEADYIEGTRCTQCGAEIDLSGENDESVDEDLHDD